MRNKVKVLKYTHLQAGIQHFNVFGCPMDQLKHSNFHDRPNMYKSLFYSIGQKEFILDRYMEITSSRDEFEIIDKDKEFEEEQKQDDFIGKKLLSSNIGACIQDNHFSATQATQGRKTSVHSSISESLQPTENYGKLTKQRSRFDTNEEMEMLGQGQYGEGNAPMLS